MRFRLVTLLLGACLLGGCFMRDAIEDAPPSAPVLTAERVSCSEALAGTHHFAAGMTVVCRKRGDGSVWATMTAAGQSHEARVWHEADFYAVSARPDVIVMHDRFTERQDRLLVFNFTPARVQYKYIGHGAETEGYLYRQFRDISITPQDVAMTEDLAGGNRPGMTPRTTRKRVPLE